MHQVMYHLHFKLAAGGADLFGYLGGIYGTGTWSSQIVGPITLMTGYHRLLFRYYFVSGTQQYSLTWNTGSCYFDLLPGTVIYDPSDCLYLPSNGYLSLSSGYGLTAPFALFGTSSQSFTDTPTVEIYGTMNSGSWFNAII